MNLYDILGDSQHFECHTEPTCPSLQRAIHNDYILDHLNRGAYQR